MVESPDVVIGMRLLDVAKRHGFQFRRLAPGPDGPLWGVRDTQDWHDTLYLGGFSEGAAPPAAASLPAGPRRPASHRARVRRRAECAEHCGQLLVPLIPGQPLVEPEALP